MDSSAYERAFSTYHELLKQRELLDCRIREAASALNATAPINRLPPDILVHIFNDVKTLASEGFRLPATDEIYPAKQPNSWFTLLSVSQTWRTVACNSPLLWQDINVGARENMPLFRLFLQRSGSADINVSFVGTDCLYSLLPELIAHRSRIRSLSFEMLPTFRANSISVLLGSHMPRLEKLAVTFGRLDWESELEHVPDNESDTAYRELKWGQPFLRLTPRDLGQLPHLANLRLRNVELVTPLALNPSFLTCLMLHNLRTAPVCLYDLLYLLERCHRLETLVLDRYSYYISSTPYHTRRIQLSPTLKWFRMQDGHSSIAMFLAKVAVPCTTRVSITKLASNREFPSSLSACFPEDRTGLPLLSQLHQVDVDLKDHGHYRRDIIRARCGDIAFMIDFRQREDLLRDIVAGLLGIFGESPITELKMSGIASGHTTTIQWTQILQHFSQLRSLTVDSQLYWMGSPATATLLLALATAQVDGNALCTELEELSIGSDYNTRNEVIVQNVITCLNARTTMGKRLRKLRVHGMDDQLLDELRPHADIVEASDGAKLLKCSRAY
ncbi:hypothetical protein GY45DRAFT_1324495 [Cubamyces sp. BRFM 1775]|nr:hypothetical protein GY45DRAFT_1324495 [Cubamyces sp. BRFM 1775]